MHGEAALNQKVAEDGALLGDGGSSYQAKGMEVTREVRAGRLGVEGCVHAEAESERGRRRVCRVLVQRDAERVKRQLGTDLSVYE